MLLRELLLLPGISWGAFFRFKKEVLAPITALLFRMFLFTTVDEWSVDVLLTFLGYSGFLFATFTLYLVLGIVNEFLLFVLMLD